MKSKLWIILTTFTLMAIGCANTQDNKLPATATQQKTDTIFRQVADFPTIKDTAKFITDLRQTFNLAVDESPKQKANESITTYKKVKIYGSEKDYIFIEYDYKYGCSAAFPWKYQLLLSTDGKPVKTLSGNHFEFVNVFKNENPFLLLLVATSRGNGGHELYKISTDTLENVYEGYFDFALRTYDAHGDHKLYEPSELALSVKDVNNDGFNDLSFIGKIVYIQKQTNNGNWIDADIINGKAVTYSIDNPFKTIPVQFIFLYDQATGHFKAKENYTKKYKLDN